MIDILIIIEQNDAIINKVLYIDTKRQIDLQNILGVYYWLNSNQPWVNEK